MQQLVFFGGFGYFLFQKLPIDPTYVYMGAIVVIIIVRVLAVKFKISLPSIYR